MMLALNAFHVKQQKLDQGTGSVLFFSVPQGSPPSGRYTAPFQIEDYKRIMFQDKTKAKEAEMDVYPEFCSVQRRELPPVNILHIWQKNQCRTTYRTLIVKKGMIRPMMKYISYLLRPLRILKKFSPSPERDRRA